MSLPVAVAVARHVLPVQVPRGGVISAVTVHLDDGRRLSFFEVVHRGRVTPAETSACAVELAREIGRRP